MSSAGASGETSMIRTCETGRIPAMLWQPARPAASSAQALRTGRSRWTNWGGSRMAKRRSASGGIGDNLNHCKRRQA